MTELDIIILMGSAFGGSLLGPLILYVVLTIRDRSRVHLCDECGFTFIKAPGVCRRCIRKRS